MLSTRRRRRCVEVAYPSAATHKVRLGTPPRGADAGARGSGGFGAAIVHQGRPADAHAAAAAARGPHLLGRREAVPPHTRRLPRRPGTAAVSRHHAAHLGSAQRDRGLPSAASAGPRRRPPRRPPAGGHGLAAPQSGRRIAHVAEGERVDGPLRLPAAPAIDGIAVYVRRRWRWRRPPPAADDRGEDVGD